MTNNAPTWYFYTGLVAAICIAVYMMPQLVRTIKTKDTVGVSVIMLSLAVIGDLFFVTSGAGILKEGKISEGLPLFLANLFGLIISAIIAFFKIRNLFIAKKLNLTEKDFCLNYKANVQRYKAEFRKKKEKQKDDQQQGM